MSENNRKICELWWEGWSFGKKLALLAVLFTGLVQAEKPCDADPRYLLVTGVAAHTWLRNDETDKLEMRPELSWTTPRLLLLDRCNNINFFNASHPSVDFPDEKIAKSQAHIAVYNDGKILARTNTRIKESMSDICRVMKDCGDATK